jgi:hypothetical protein
MVHRGRAAQRNPGLPTMQEIIASLGNSPSITGRIFGGF